MKNTVEIDGNDFRVDTDFATWPIGEFVSEQRSEFRREMDDADFSEELKDIVLAPCPLFSGW